MPSGSPGIVACAVPSLTLLRRVEDGAKLTVPSLPPEPSQLWQPTGSTENVCMKRSAWYVEPGTSGTATLGHGYGLHTRSGPMSAPSMFTCVFIAMSATSQPAASGTPMRLARSCEMRTSAARTASVRSLSASSNMMRSL